MQKYMTCTQKNKRLQQNEILIKYFVILRRLATKNLMMLLRFFAQNDSCILYHFVTDSYSSISPKNASPLIFKSLTIRYSPDNSSSVFTSTF